MLHEPARRVVHVRSPRSDSPTCAPTRPTGVQLGCWGLLVDVRPNNGPAADSPAGWDPAIDDGASGAAVSHGPLLAPNRNVGYVHAPSLAQARTAGVLRAGELTHSGDGTTLASLDLTSRRARIARDMIDAVANGLPLGAVLGYRLERSLGDAGLHDAVTNLRAAFPQRRSEGAAGAPAGADNVVPPEVLDGLDVWHAGDAAAALAGVAAGQQEALAARTRRPQGRGRSGGRRPRRRRRAPHHVGSRRGRGRDVRRDGVGQPSAARPRRAARAAVGHRDHEPPRAPPRRDRRRRRVGPRSCARRRWPPRWSGGARASWARRRGGAPRSATPR